MKTFDEAVELTFKESEAGKTLIFFKEAITNKVIHSTCARALFVLRLGMTDPQVALITIFLMGVNVGREMEKQELTIPDQTH